MPVSAGGARTALSVFVRQLAPSAAMPTTWTSAAEQRQRWVGLRCARQADQRGTPGHVTARLIKARAVSSTGAPGRSITAVILRSHRGWARQPSRDATIEICQSDPIADAVARRATPWPLLGARDGVLDLRSCNWR